MKKIFTILLALVASVGIMNAGDIIDGIMYELNADDSTAQVTSSSSYSGDITIPSSVTYESVTYSVVGIKSYAFSYNSNITSVVIGNNVTSIGDYAFNTCIGLTSVIIGNNVTNIGIAAFGDCSGLTSVIIGNSVTNIGNYAFAWCDNLLYVTCLGDRPANIGDGIFRSNNINAIYVPCGTLDAYKNAWSDVADRIAYTPLVLEYTIEGRVNDTIMGSVELPKTICDGYTITAVANKGYHFVKWSDGVTANPRTFTLTQDTAFTAEFALTLSGVCGKDDALSWIYQPSNGMCMIVGNGELTENYTFSTAVKQAKTLTIGDGVTAIGASAFYNCPMLEQVILPNSLTAIERIAFRTCPSLRSIEIPENVKKIGAGAFVECSSLQSITIPEGVEDLEEAGTFQRCTGLKSVIWKAKNPKLTADEKGTIYAMFLNDDSIVSFEFGDKVETIPYALCAYLTGLKEITIPESVNTIGYGAFVNCAGLTSITIPVSVTSIAEQAFFSCSGLDTLRILNGEATVDKNAIYDCLNLRYLETPASLLNNYVSNYWRWYSTKLTKVIVNGGTLEALAFDQLKLSNATLRSIDLGRAQVSAFAAEEFGAYRQLEELVLPSSLTMVDYAAMANCYYLKTINIPENVTEIDDRAFDNCRSLASVEFAGNNVKRIGNWAFYNCHELTNISLPESVSEIGSAAFYGCTNMQTAHLPASVRAIGDNAFALCSKLAKMDVDAIEPPMVEEKTFYEVSTKAPVYVPEESVEIYKSHPIWGKLNIIGKNNAPQGIDQITNGQSQITNKIIKDNHLLILRGEKIYTVQGQEVK